MPMSKSTDDLIRDLQASGVLEGSKAVAARPGAAATPTRPGRAPISSVLVVIAVILVAVIGSLPFAAFALYPFALFVTLIHESSHALATIATGGVVDQIQISPDLSGVTRTGGGLRPLIDSAGYLGATMAGVGLLLTPLRHARRVLGALALIPLAALFFFHPADLFTVLWCVGFAAALGVAAWKLSSRLAAFLQIFLGVEAGLNAFRDVMTLVLISNTAPHMQTDATNMAGDLFLPSAFWAVTWTVLSIALLASALLALLRRDFAR
jgi:hypothetical protein